MKAGITRRTSGVLPVGLAVAAFWLFGPIESSLAGRARHKPTFNPMTLDLFTSGTLYLGQYETGLYPGGKNEMPQPHRKAGERIAATIRPLNVDGQTDDNGRIVALVFGHFNSRLYFSALQDHFLKNADQLNPQFELLNAATTAQHLPEIRQLEGIVWDRADRLLRDPSCRRKPLTGQPVLSRRQVQVLFLHTTYNAAGASGPPRPFPETMRRMQRDLAAVLEHCVSIYPNLRIAYLTCDGLRVFTGAEPHVWQEAFAFKWLIENQIKGEEGTVFEDNGGKKRTLPWLSWGPYIWDNTWDRRYFTDGVHPAPKALDIFVSKYWGQLKADRAARPWLFRPASRK
jgi:hypothetical protein